MRCIHVIICAFILISQTQSLPRSYRQTSEDLPQLAASLFHDYQQQQFTIPPNFNLNYNFQNNLQAITSKFIESFKRTVSLLANSYNENSFNAEAAIQNKIEKEIGEHFTQKPYSPSTYEEVTTPKKVITTPKEVSTTPKNYEIIKEELLSKIANKLVTTTEAVPTEIIHRSSFPENINKEAKKLDYYTDLTLPKEKSLNIFLTKNLENLPELNLTSLSLPAEDSVNFFYINDKSDVQKLSSINLQDSEEEIANKMYNIIYNFPLPLVEKISKFMPFNNFETSTFSSFETVKIEGRFPEIEIPEDVFELPVGESENFEGKTKKGVDYRSLSEIPLEESPVFDLNKKDLTNSYGTKITTFKR